MKSIYYKDGYKYQLGKSYKEVVDIHPEKTVQNTYTRLEPDGTLTIAHGYAWDGPSGPTVDTKTFMRGSLVHDALYQLIREGKLPLEAREQADKELKRICIEDGMNSVRAWLVYQGVNIFGATYTMQKSSKFIKAP